MKEGRYRDGEEVRKEELTPVVETPKENMVVNRYGLHSEKTGNGVHSDTGRKFLHVNYFCVLYLRSSTINYFMKSFVHGIGPRHRMRRLDS